MNTDRTQIRIANVRRQFDARVERFGQHDALVREAGNRMLERLAMLRHTPANILDLGCGMGRAQAALQARFPEAQIFGADLSEAMLRADPKRGAGTGAGQPGRSGLLGHIGQWRWGTLRSRRSEPMSRTGVCADAGHLPWPGESIDLVFSNLMLSWHPAPHAVIDEVSRVLRTGGLVLFSAYGPDTLRELRAACLRTGMAVRPMPYVDMHDFGDMLVTAGFETPVTESETLRLTFDDPRRLLTEVRALGANPRADRVQGLPSGRMARALLAELDALRDAEGRIPLTFEIATGHGWKGRPRPQAAPSGVATIAMPRPRRERGTD